MTFLDFCLVCGGPVEEWDEYTARCVGYCKSKQERLEDVSPERLRWLIRVVNKRRAIENAEEIEPGGDRL